MMKEDIGPARVVGCQTMLFPRTAREVCSEIGLNWLAAVKLFEEKWLSFNPEAVTVLDEGEEAELGFVGSLVVGGCHGDLLRQLLTGLGKPYRYRIGKIYYDWSIQHWRLLPQRQAAHSTFYDWLEELKGCGDIKQLQEIQEIVQDAIIQAEKQINLLRC